jgi:hypothetical protein
MYSHCHKVLLHLGPKAMNLANLGLKLRKLSKNKSFLLSNYFSQVFVTATTTTTKNPLRQ